MRDRRHETDTLHARRPALRLTHLRHVPTSAPVDSSLFFRHAHLSKRSKEDQMSTRYSRTYNEVAREDVPQGSFRYAQLASVDELDAPLDAWLVATSCAKFVEGSTTNEFVDVLCVHFVYTREDDARHAAHDVARSHETTLVRPASPRFTSDRDEAIDAYRKHGADSDVVYRPRLPMLDANSDNPLEASIARARNES